MCKSMSRRLFDLLISLVPALFVCLFRPSLDILVATFAFMGWAFLELIQEVPSNLDDAVVNQDRGSRRLLIWIRHLTVLIPCINLLVKSGSHVSYILILVGFVMSLTGTYVRLKSMKTLRVFFTMELLIKPEQTLVTHGIYRHLRHPSYTGLILIYLAFPVTCSSLVGFCVTGISLALALRYRIRLEEKMLAVRFGSKFFDYRESVPGLIPFFIKRHK